MRRSILAGAVLLASIAAAPAQAADLPRKAPPVVAPIAYSWSGFYLGGHLGGGWMKTDTVRETGSGTFPVGFASSAEAEGVVAGGQIGFNWQIGQFVLGIEGDGSWTSIAGTAGNESPLLAGRSQRTHTDVEWIATATGRVGYAFDNALWYVKGGWAWVGVDRSSITQTRAGAVVSTSTGGETRNGWTIGTGVEWGFAPNWSARIEYNYIDLGSDTTSSTVVNTPAFGGTVSTALTSSDAHLHLVKAGLNYRFAYDR